MGWAYGKNSDGREVGYGVEAKCDFPGCDEDIDRGMGYCCGGMHNGMRDDSEAGCGGYFCYEQEHMYEHDCPHPNSDEDEQEDEET